MEDETRTTVPSNPGSSSNANPAMGMGDDEFRAAAIELVEYIINYYRSLPDRKPFPDVKPGFMRPKLEADCPEGKHSWQSVFRDIESVVMEGMTHWHAPGFFAYFPTATSYPALLGDMLCSAVSCIGFTWASSPSCTELETVMMDWLAQALNLPPCFIHNGKGPGAGGIESTVSEATLMALLAARSKAIRDELARDPSQSTVDILGRLVAYTSKYSHSCMDRAGQIAFVKVRALDVDGDISLRGTTLRAAIDEDKSQGKIPVFVGATFGTTVCCSYDNLTEIGDVCNEEGIWMHVDAAYAGSALICPEYRHLGYGLEKSTSFCFNPHKNLMTNFDCCAFWVRDMKDMVNSLNVNPIFLRHNEQQSTIDYRHWQVPLGRRMRSIKLWFVLKMVGLEALREHVRRGPVYAKYFEKLLREDRRFEILFPVTLGLVCFRLVKDNLDLQKTNELNEELYKNINSDRRVHITPSVVNEIYFLRVSTSSINNSHAEMDKCFRVIQEIATPLLT